MSSFLSFYESYTSIPELVSESYRFRTRSMPYQGRGKVESSVIWLSTGTFEYGTGTGTFRNRYGSNTSSWKVVYVSCKDVWIRGVILWYNCRVLPFFTIFRTTDAVYVLVDVFVKWNNTRQLFCWVIFWLK